MSGAINSRSADDDQIDFGRLLGSLSRGKWKIAACALLALGAGNFYALGSDPVYQADALIQLEDRAGGRMLLPEGMRDLLEGASSAATESQIIASRMVLGPVAADLNLDWQIAPARAPLIGGLLAQRRLPLPEWRLLRAYQRRGEGLELAQLAVPPEWVGEPIGLEVTAGGYRIALPDGQRLEGAPGQPLSLPEQGFTLEVARMEAPQGRVYTLRQISQFAAITELRGVLAVTETGRQSGILWARLTGTDRAQIEQVLTAITESYVRQNIARSAAEAGNSLDFIRAQLPQAEARLNTAQGNLNRYREQVADNARSAELTASGEGYSFETQTLLNQISRVEADLHRVTRRLEETQTRLGETHPALRQIRREQSELETRLAGLLARSQDLPETQREVINLAREVELAQQIYFDLQTRAQEMQVLQASAVGSVRIVDPANAGEVQVAPRRGVVLALSLGLGLAAGLFWVMLAPLLRSGLRSPEDLERLGLPVYATIGYSRNAGGRRRRQRRGEALPILALEYGDDLVVEAFRSLRTALHFGMLDASGRSLVRTLVLTSAAPEAGKSFTAVNLAVVAAQAGLRVALVDADMRRGKLRRYFGLPREAPGLAQVLAGEIDGGSAMVETKVEGLSLLPAGPYPPNPSELLMRPVMAELLQEMDAYFDLVLVDCPPVLAVTDPVIVARQAAMVLLVTWQDITPPGEVEAVQRSFQAAGLRLSGAVLNGYRAARGEEGYGHGYRYAYAPRKD